MPKRSAYATYLTSQEDGINFTVPQDEQTKTIFSSYWTRTEIPNKQACRHTNPICYLVTSS